MGVAKTRRNLDTRYRRLEQKFRRLVVSPGIEKESFFDENFENWNNWGWTLYLNPSSYPQVLAIAARSGSYGLRSLKVSGYTDAATAVNTPAYTFSDKIGDWNAFSVIAYIKITGLSNITSVNTQVVLNLESTSTIILRLALYNDGSGVQYNAYTWLPNVPADEYFGSMDGTWHKIRFDYKEHATAGLWRIWLNDTKIYEFNGDTTDPGYTQYLDYFLIGGYGFASTATHILDYDDIKIYPLNQVP